MTFFFCTQRVQKNDLVEVFSRAKILGSGRLLKKELKTSRQDIIKCEMECNQISVEKMLWLFSSVGGIVDSSQIIPPTELVITPMQATFGPWLSPIRSPNKVIIICMITHILGIRANKIKLRFQMAEDLSFLAYLFQDIFFLINETMLFSSYSI